MLRQQNAPVARIPDAAPTAWPSVLIEPAWRRTDARVGPVVIAAPVIERPVELRWAPMEQAEWATTVLWRWADDYEAWCTFAKSLGTTIDDPTWPARIAEAVARQSPWLDNALAIAPEELVRPHLSAARPGYVSSGGPTRRILGRYGLTAVDFVIAVAARSPQHFAHLLSPLEGTAITTLMLDWVNRKRSRESALAWFGRHSLRPHSI
jgi:hypothetical protein